MLIRMVSTLHERAIIQRVMYIVVRFYLNCKTIKKLRRFSIFMKAISERQWMLPIEKCMKSQLVKNISARQLIRMPTFTSNSNLNENITLYIRGYVLFNEIKCQDNRCTISEEEKLIQSIVSLIVCSHNDFSLAFSITCTSL